MKRILFILISIAICLGFVSFAQAQFVDLTEQIREQTSMGAETAGLESVDSPQFIITDIIEIMLSVTGVIFLALVFYGGYLYVASRGDEEQAKKAMNIIKASIIGLAIVLFSYAITLFVGTQLAGQEAVNVL